MFDKKLMILGASPGQLPVIKKAVDMGFYVITADYIPDNIGHKFSHKFVYCSTVEKDCVLRLAEEHNIDGILTFASDVATQTVGYVTEKLGLAGYSPWIAETMSNKAKFRRFQKENGGNNPGYVIGNNWSAIQGKIAGLSTPLMFKPVDTSGSRGITRVDNWNPEHLETAFNYAQSFSRSKLVCVEEYIPGNDVSGDGFLINGRLHAVTTHKYKDGFRPKGHSLPTNLSIKDQERVNAAVEHTCNKIGYTDGPLDFDVRVSSDQVGVIEMSPRLGGNGIPSLIARATNTDLIKLAINHALGLGVDKFPELAIKQRCGSWIYGSNQKGYLESIASNVELKDRIPEVFEYLVDYEVGEEVPQLVHSGNSMGYVLFDLPNNSSYDEMTSRIRTALQLKVTVS